MILIYYNIELENNSSNNYAIILLIFYTQVECVLI